MSKKKRKAYAQYLEKKSQLLAEKKANSTIASADPRENSILANDSSTKQLIITPQKTKKISLETFHSLPEKLNKKEQQIAELKEQIDQQVKTAHALQKQVDKKDKQVEEAQEQLEKQKAKLEERDRDSQALQKKIDKKDKHIVDLEEQLEKQTKNNHSLQKQLEVKDKKITALEQETKEQKINGLLARLTQQETQIFEQIKSHQVLQQKLIAQEEKIAEQDRNYLHLKQEHQSKLAELQNQLAQQNSIAALGTAHLNKWRKHHFSS
jgi:chromosome segregation ATPase